MTEKVSEGYVSRSGDFPKKENFDGLHKQLKNAFGKNYQKRKLYARNFRKMPEKS